MDYLYVRYFDEEAVVENVAEAIEFLKVLPEIEVTPELEKELREYAEGSQNYTKHIKKPGSKNYIIVIKSPVNTLQEFKENRNQRSANIKKQSNQSKLNELREGWYEGTLDFKRVTINHMGKCEYRDTTFTAACKASSVMNCYDRITEYLSQHVDKRSQFPSVKGKNFRCSFLGYAKSPEQQEEKVVEEEAENNE